MASSLLFFLLFFGGTPSYESSVTGNVRWPITRPACSVCTLQVLRLVDTTANYSAAAGPGHFNDMDMLEVGNGMTQDQDRVSSSVTQRGPRATGCTEGPSTAGPARADVGGDAAGVSPATAVALLGLLTPSRTHPGDRHALPQGLPRPPACSSRACPAHQPAHLVAPARL